MMIIRTIFLFVFTVIAIGTHAQRVTVSKEMPIRNDVAYDIIGLVKDNFVLYRDRGNERIVEIFDKDMKHLFQREINLDRDRSEVYAIVPHDTTFTIIFGYREKRFYNMKAHKFNSFGLLVDSVTYLNNVENFRLESFKYALSEDRSKTLLFTNRKNDLFYTYVIDNIEMRLLWRKESKMVGFDVRKDFRSVVVSNDGEVNALFDIDNSKYDRENHHMILVGLDSKEGLFENVFKFQNKMTVDVEMGYDDKNKRIILAGLVSDESEFDASGYFYFSKPVSQLESQIMIEDHDFDLNFLSEIYGKKLSKKKRLNDFVTRDIVLRADGGFLLFTEMNKEYYRRSAFNGGTRFNNGFNNGGRGWVDIYNEDIIVFSFHPDNTEHWKKILYKKQFSQDDAGVYSSYFLFKTPSRIRLIYNDEIKRNNTVSEYVLDPIGNFERNSLLSTEYQNLKLRFRNALQVSSNILIVPSERNYKLSLVKIEY